MPGFFLFLAAVISTQTQSYAVKRLLLMPIVWPMRLYFYLFDMHPKLGFEFEYPHVTAIMLIGNFLFYASLTYLAFRVLSKRGSHRLYR